MSTRVSSLIILFFSLLISAILGFLCTGCGTERADEIRNIEAENIQTKSYTVQDVFGNVVQLRHKPQRIVSTSISTDEILLGLVGSGRLVALSTLIDDPGISNMVKEGKEVQRRVEKTSPESIINLHPDLIIFPDFIKPEAIQTFKDMNFPVYVYKTPHSVQEVEETIRVFAKLVSEEERGEELIADMEARLSKVKKKVSAIPGNKQKRVVLIRSNGVYYSPNSSFSDLCRRAGVKDSTMDLNYPYGMIVQEEEIIKMNPDVFFIVDWNYDGKHDPGKLLKELLNNPSYKNTKAIQNKQVFFLKGATVQSLSQYMVSAVEEIAERCYPEAFK